MSNFFIEVFAELFSKSDRIPYYLQASSIATATATCHIGMTVGSYNNSLVLLRYVNNLSVFGYISTDFFVSHKNPLSLGLTSFS